MNPEDVRRRGVGIKPAPLPAVQIDVDSKTNDSHSVGKPKHGPLVQILRGLLFATWFHMCCVSIGVTQFIGAPLYWVSKDYFYAYMALTKQSFGTLVVTITQWFSPTTIRVSWDADLKGHFTKTKDGRLETNFPHRIVLLANHQIYTDWLYLWWFAYTSNMHGHIYIILKETLKYIPILGSGMMFFGFVFMARKWASDKSRLAHRLGKLKARHSGPLSGPAGLDPMWLLIFPEGTNLSANTRKKSLKWAESQGMPDLKYQVLPHSTGLHFCLKELDDSVEWVYDCTMAYEGVTPGGYAQDIFTLRSTWLQGRPPTSVNLYWRRFAVKDIPLADQKVFEAWVLDRWKEKDQLLEQFFRTGRFPASPEQAMKKGQGETGYIETQVSLRSWLDVAQIFVVLATSALICNVLTKLYEMFS